MDQRQATGEIGQRAAVRFMTFHGYTILEEHYRLGHAEIDIIAQFADELIAVEVKTIRVIGDTRPEYPVQISQAQSQRISHALAQYAYVIGHEGDYRFDQVQVYDYGADHVEIEHYKEAWFPG